MSEALRDWIVYSRQGCGLCENFMMELAALLGPDESERVQVVDIEGNDELQRKYAHRIPVLAIEGDFVCAYRLDVERVRAFLDR